MSVQSYSQARPDGFRNRPQCCKGGKKRSSRSPLCGTENPENEARQVLGCIISHVCLSIMRRDQAIVRRERPTPKKVTRRERGIQLLTMARVSKYVVHIANELRRSPGFQKARQQILRIMVWGDLQAATSPGFRKKTEREGNGSPPTGPAVGEKEMGFLPWRTVQGLVWSYTGWR